MTARLRLLHVEDERNARLMLADLVGPEVELVQVASAEEGLARVDAPGAPPFDVTLLDWQLPGLDGGEFLARVRGHGRAGRVVVLTAVGTLERAVAALRLGAYDFLTKPVDPDALLALLERAGRSAGLLDDAGARAPAVIQAPAGLLGEAAGARDPADEANPPAGGPSAPAPAGPPPPEVGGDLLLGESPALRAVRARLAAVAASDAPVLVLGESGTGKELVARALHEASGRHRGRLVVVNCAALPDALLEAELFGHKRGSFTGAAADRPGLFELAHEGTLFLDEVGELAPAAQAKLLRALQERRVRRVGDDRDRPVDARVIAATHRDLDREVDRGAFRQDLLYRLDVVRVELPPLRARLADLPQLLCHLLARHAAAWDRPAPTPTPAHLARLLAHPWPGNVRELENVARRVVLLGPEQALAELARGAGPQPFASPAGSPPATAGAPAPGTQATPPAAAQGPVRPLADVVADATRAAIVAALAAHDGSRTKAADALGVSRKTLFNKMRELGIQEESSWS